MSSETKKFPLGDVLSITTGRLVSRDGVAALYGVLNFLTRDELYTHVLPRAADACRPWILSCAPQLENVVFDVEPDSWEGWLRDKETCLGAEIELAPLPDGAWEKRSPVQEAAEIFGAERVIVVKP